MSISVDKLESLINDAKEKSSQPVKILIGYKAYADLMQDRSFFDEVAGSAMDPMKRTYKKIKIKVTQDQYQLELKHKNHK